MTAHLNPKESEVKLRKQGTGVNAPVRHVVGQRSDDGAVRNDFAIEDGLNEAVAFLRPPNPNPDPSCGRSVVAVDRQAYTEEDLATFTMALEEHWCASLDRMYRSPPTLCKAGATISDHFGFSISKKCTAEFLGLARADDEMCRAFQAALLGAASTTVGPLDLDTIKRALASFIHAHPFFCDAVKNEPWEHPFGEQTIYTIAQFNVLPNDSKD